MQTRKVTLSVNGQVTEVETEPYELLSFTLRERLGLTGTKRGCDYGGCGCCTVLVDDRAVYSCMMPIRRLANKQVITVEGLAKDGQLDPIQKSFVAEGAFQCGYCTPGFIMSGEEILRRKMRASREEIANAIAGNICRCTGYGRIIDAIQKAEIEIRENVRDKQRLHG